MNGKQGTLFINLGLLLIATALFLAGYNRYTARQAEQTAENVLPQLGQALPTAPLERGTPALPEYPKDPHREMPVQTIDGRDYIGVLRIPALELELPILSECTYPNLKMAPCRYFGSAYNGSLVLAAHNYSTHFGRLNTLQAGDSVVFTDMEGTVLSYQVSAMETLAPSDVEAMATGDWDLTLFTCILGGQSRVTIRCVRVESEVLEKALLHWGSAFSPGATVSHFLECT